MILELKHPTRGDIGKVVLKDGKVIHTATARCSNGSCYDPLRQMKGWIEPSVREYAKSQNWICTTITTNPLSSRAAHAETSVVKPTSDMQMSKGEDFDSRR